jgi:hypothetical protein
MAERPPSPILSAKRVTEKLGYRKLSKAELVKLGFSEKSERFTSAPPKSKRLIPANTLSKRDAYKRLALALTGEKLSNEKLAQRRKEDRGGRNPLDAYNRLLARQHELTQRPKKELRNDPTFKKLLKDARDERKQMPKNYKTAHAKNAFKAREQERTQRRLKALAELFPEDEAFYTRLLEMYH